MKVKRAAVAVFSLFVISVSGASVLPECFASSVFQTREAGQPAVAKRIGAIKTINGNTLTLAPDSGSEVTVTVQSNARILRIAPGEKDLTNATSLQLQELQVGDTIRARGQASDDGKSIAALEIIVITRSAVQAVSEQIRQDWQKRGIGGPVSTVDSAAGTVSISIPSLGGISKMIVVHTSKSTVIRRYAPDSAKPEDAKLSTLQEIYVNDQLHARGNRSADGSELAAEEIFTGIFPQYPGLVKSVDANLGTLSVQDLATNKTVQLKITADSQLHKIPSEMAQRFAMRLKARLPPGMPGAGASSSPGSSATTSANGQAAPGGAPSEGTSQGGGMGGAGRSGGMRSGGGFDFQRLLDQTPTVMIADLHKGDAVYVLTTQGTPSGGSTVIKLVSGVEPILQAAPNGSQAMMLAPWSLGGAPNGDAGP
jgi:hypothetical protein